MTAANRRIVALVALCCVAVWYAGSYHFIHGSQVEFQKLKKISWSLSETIINADEVAGTPLIVMRARYPLLLQSMEAAKE